MIRKVAGYKIARFRENLMRKLAFDDELVAKNIAKSTLPGHKPAPWPLIDLAIKSDGNLALAGLIQAIEKGRKPGIDLNDLETWGPTKERAEVYDRISRESGGKLDPAAMENELVGFKTPEQRAAEKREAIKQTIKSYAPWVGGGAGLGALLGGGIGYGVSGKTGGTLLGTGLGALGGAGVGGLGKYLYDKHKKK